MGMPAEASEATSSQLIHQLGAVCQTQGLADLASRLRSLQGWVNEDLANFEKELQVIPRGSRAIIRAAHHLLDLRGKHLRPVCVALASRVGTGFSPAARKLAMAVELVHTATLLHDDVIDMSEMRRGEPTARCVYGNAAAVFAGDWLLVQALKQIRQARVPEALDRMLDVIDSMILAESIQLEHRGKIRDNLPDYFRVVEGKTASLFRWAMFAGARAGNLSIEVCSSLESYGSHIGIAFQAIDDLLDFTGDSVLTGKDLFSDLREGKMTYPLAVALQRDPGLRVVLEQWMEQPQSLDSLKVASAGMQAIRASLETNRGLSCLQKARSSTRIAGNFLSP